METVSGGFTLGSIGNDGTNLFTNTVLKDGSKGSVIDVDTGANTNVYVYDFSYGINSSSRLTLNGAVSTGASDNYAEDKDGSSNYFNWNKASAGSSVYDEVRNAVTFALVRMVDGEARDVLLIMPDNIK